ncbi:MAG: hypothetical protein IT285_14175 [Bdellovibrionales bacterium]|nr:hypothetical protein [Bdellovibrionales bacterium]
MTYRTLGLRALICWVILSVPSAEAAESRAWGRFKPWVVDLQGLIRPGESAGETAQRLLGSSARISAFNLQALGRIYSELDPKFDEFRGELKRLEDSIGEYDKWVSVLDAASSDSGSSAADLDRLRRRVREAKLKLTEMLKEREWVVEAGSGERPRLQRIERFLRTFDWAEYSEDRDFVLGRLSKQLKKVDETEYDISILEHGDGVHELRRELRWFLIQARVLNGLVTFRPASEGCDVAELRPLLQQPIAESKYSALPGAGDEPETCGISRCLFIGLVYWVEELGAVKDQAEQILNASGEEESDEVPAALRERAERAYRALVRTGALGELRRELRECRG